MTTHMVPLKEETLEDRNFRGPAEPRNIYFLRTSAFARGQF